VNVKCFNCGIVYNGNFCPNCGAPATLPYQQKQKSGIPTSVIIALSFIGSFCLLIVGILFLNLIFNSSPVEKATRTQETSETKIDPETVNIDVFFDATRFIVDNERTVSEAELIEMLGEPDSIDEWNYESYQSLLGKEVEYTIRSLYYNNGTYEYKFNNDMLQRITITEEFQYKSKEDILPMFGLKKYSNTKISDLNVSYRCSNCGVSDFWIYDMDENTVNGINISYGSLFE
jgi:hypothetical protein